MNNNVKIIGHLTDLNFEYEYKGVNIYSAELSIERNSGYIDILPVLVKETVIDKYAKENGIEIDWNSCPKTIDLHDKGKMVIEGQLRSYNKEIEGKRKLVLSVFAQDMYKSEDPDTNEITLVGHVCKPVGYRVTPLKKSISDILLAVNREHHKSDYIPCIAWGRDAELAEEFDIGDEIIIKGRIQSREYMKDGENKVAYEVSASYIDWANNAE